MPIISTLVTKNGVLISVNVPLPISYTYDPNPLKSVRRDNLVLYLHTLEPTNYPNLEKEGRSTHAPFDCYKHLSPCESSHSRRHIRSLLLKPMLKDGLRNIIEHQCIVAHACQDLSLNVL